MFRTKRRIILFIAAFIVVVGVIFVFALSQKAPTAIATNGRKVTIEKVTFGTHHRFTQGKWWMRLLKPIMGNRWAAQRGCYETRFTHNAPGLMVWTRWEGATASNGIPVEATVLDDVGTESEFVLNQWNAVPPFSAGGVLENAYVAWLFRNSPRRSENIRLRVYDRDRRYMPTQAVEIAFANPARKRITEWPGSALPLAIKTNNTEFALTSAQQVSNALWRLDFVVRTNGISDRSWLVGGITALSAGGSVLSTHLNLAATGGTNLTFHLRGALWPEEPVWRFATDLFRMADFQPNELWVLTNVAVPSRALPLKLTTNLVSYGNYPVELELASTAPYIPWRRGDIRRNANLSVRFDAADAHLFLLTARDDQGKEVRTEIFPGSPRHVYSFGLEIPQGAQSLNLTFAIRRPTVINFDVAERNLKRLDGTGRP